MISYPVTLLVAASIVTTLAAVEPPPGTREDLRRMLERLPSEGLRIEDAEIAAVDLLPEIYAGLNFEYLWTRRMATDLMQAIDDSASHGLDPLDYHRRALAVRLQALDDAGTSLGSDLELELLLSDAFLRLAYTLHFGKLDPLDSRPTWKFDRSLNPLGTVPVVNQALARGEITAFLEGVAPSGPIYTRMRGALARYRAIAAAGGWPAVPPGQTLEEGARGERVALLRARLEVTDDQLGTAVDDRDLFDAELAAAVGRFQATSGLEVDGRVGPQTLAVLAVTANHRVEQLRANLERIRWVFPDAGDDFVVVNIAGFKLYLIRGRQMVWSTRVQVGKPYHQTPVFRDRITYLVFNPTWTVPTGILRNELLPAIREDPSYLTKQNLTVLDPTGQVVDPSTVDWNATFPYTIRQEPGPTNALGRVKFMFPNPYHVYLHDTPSRNLFERADRSFSHGCIRVEDPLRLAELLLATTPGWTREGIESAVASGVTRTVSLAHPMPLMLLYFTAEVPPQGTVIFYRDPYDRDRAVIFGLNAPFVTPSVVGGIR